MTRPKIDNLDDLRHLLDDLPGPDVGALAKTAAREPQLTKPPGALGRLEDLSAWLAAWQGRHPPTVDTPTACVFAGNHGVTAQGVSAFPSEVTAQMVANFEAGGAAVNQLCAAFGASLTVETLDLDTPTADMTAAPAMDETACVAALRTGMAAVADGSDVLCLGEMGIGNTTSAAAICNALFGGEAADWTGPGTGVSGAALVHKAAVVAQAIDHHGEALNDPLEVLRRLGGRELAAICGAIVQARLAGVPVLLDGYVCTAAAAVLDRAQPGALDHCQIGHVSAEPGHRRLVDALAKAPLLDLGMRLGEASGAVLALGLLRGAVACHAGMATFADAGVSDKDG